MKVLAPALRVAPMVSGLDAAVYCDIEAIVGVDGLHHRECFADLWVACRV